MYPVSFITMLLIILFNNEHNICIITHKFLILTECFNACWRLSNKCLEWNVLEKSFCRWIKIKRDVHIWPYPYNFCMIILSLNHLIQFQVVQRYFEGARTSKNSFDIHRTIWYTSNKKKALIKHSINGKSMINK